MWAAKPDMSGAGRDCGTDGGGRHMQCNTTAIPIYYRHINCKMLFARFLRTLGGEFFFLFFFLFFNGPQCYRTTIGTNSGCFRPKEELVSVLRTMPRGRGVAGRAVKVYRVVLAKSNAIDSMLRRGIDPWIWTTMEHSRFFLSPLIAIRW
ncbi:hypothetical protein BDP81DRAFT_421227 [Colletotrichum phormii]|uniref:Uncharacterized protein n=1 Tax=Colletotrichum phormii TaxID=359342 RepID=A0AAJ0EK32_9PEZI|nr:uncharacterized protein BDP81DRAFT_421227 [Colletotrichum phormii]KAK1639535.1 hypothetical protein BDP81DRAFT_421227 [Colletotrichum phormii]